MQSISNLRQRLTALLPTALKIYLLAVIFFLSVLYIGRLFGIDIYLLATDPGEVAQQPPYVGLISNVGILLWCGTAAVCLFSASLNKPDPAYSKKWSAFLTASGIFTSILLLDDMFQLHETYSVIFVGPDANLSVNNRRLQNIFESVFFVSYFSCFFLFLFYFRRQIQRTEYAFLILAFICFAASVVIDVTPLVQHSELHSLTEEGFKFLGIVSWATYFFRTSRIGIQ